MTLSLYHPTLLLTEIIVYFIFKILTRSHELKKTMMVDGGWMVYTTPTREMNFFFLMNQLFYKWFVLICIYFVYVNYSDNYNRKMIFILNIWFHVIFDQWNYWVRGLSLVNNDDTVFWDLGTYLFRYKCYNYCNCKSARIYFNNTNELF